MIITKTPLRMSYVGGGSDLPSHYRKHGGAVLSAGIDKYIYILVKNRFEKGIRLSYSQTENVSKVDQISHPLVRNALDMLEVREDIEIISSADIPASGTGLGSSSSFSVGLIKALLEYKKITETTESIAELACKLEIDICCNPIGKQDQYAAAFGGLNVFVFNQDDSVKIKKVKCSNKTIQNLNEETLAFYIGGKRSANEILKEQSEEIKKTEKLEAMKKMVDLVWVLKKEFESNSTEDFGAILHENWIIKRDLSKGISSSYINEVYNVAINSGATGGKLLGAGGGGFMIFHAPSEISKLKIRKNLEKLREVKFNIEPSGTVVRFF